jgi:hypothetical protein
MLPDRYCKLLTAYVDGEASKHQVKVVTRLLERFPEARAFLAELQKNARALKELPVQSLEADFAEQVMSRISGAPPAHLPVHAGAPAPFPGWVGLASAAAVLVAVTTVSFLFFRSGNRPDESQPVVQQPPVQEAPKDTGMHVALADLTQEKGRAQLARELGKEKAVHLDVPVRHSADAVKQLSRVMKDNHIQVLVDPGVRSGLAKGPAKIVVYAENLRPEELVKILGQLGAKEGQEREFDQVVLQAMTSEHQEHMSRLLGLAKLDEPDPSSLFQDTFIKGGAQEKKKVPSVKDEPAASSERFALVLAGSRGQASLSQEILRFRQNRQARRAGTLQVMLVLRPASA